MQQTDTATDNLLLIPLDSNSCNPAAVVVVVVVVEVVVVVLVVVVVSQPHKVYS